MMLSETLNTSEGSHKRSLLSTAGFTADLPAHQQKKRRHLLQQQPDADISSLQAPRASKRVKRQFIRMPCKARGMSTKHNSNTAFLDVPMDAPHGFLLSCSHPECTESGRRFRYCTVCDNPVAKRNFPKRHGHGLIRTSKDLKAVDYMHGFTVSTSSVEDATCSPCGEVPTVLFAANALPGAAAPSFEKPRHRRVVSYETVLLHTAQKSAALLKKKQSLVASAAPRVKSFLDLSVNEQQWLELLHDRPQKPGQSAVLSSWMDKVIRVSEDYRSTTRKAQIIPTSRTNSPIITPEATTSPSSQQERGDPILGIPHFAEPRIALEIADQTVAPPVAPISSTTTSSTSTSLLLNEAKLKPGFLGSDHEPPADLGNAAMHRLLRDEATAIGSEGSAFAAVLDNIDMPPMFE